MNRFILCSATLCLFAALAVAADDTEKKLETYRAVTRVLPQLEIQLIKLNDSITFAEEKTKSAKSDAMKKLFEDQLEKMEDQKESVESNIQKLTSVIEELSKDPEVGSLIEGEEATRKLKQKLDKATTLLPKVD